MRLAVTGEAWRQGKKEGIVVRRVGDSVLVQADLGEWDRLIVVCWGGQRLWLEYYKGVPGTFRHCTSRDQLRLPTRVSPFMGDAGDVRVWLEPIFCHSSRTPAAGQEAYFVGDLVEEIQKEMELLRDRNARPRGVPSA